MGQEQYQTEANDPEQQPPEVGEAPQPPSARSNASHASRLSSAGSRRSVGISLSGGGGGPVELAQPQEDPPHQNQPPQLPHAETKEGVVELSHRKCVQQFNSWLVEGPYHAPSLADCVVTPSVKRRGEREREWKELTSERTTQIARQKKETGKRKPYVPKVGVAAVVAQKKGEKKRITDEAKSRLRSTSPWHPPEPGDPPSSKRNQIRANLEDKTENSRYRTLFPPLMSPYDRQPNFLRGWGNEARAYYSEDAALAERKNPAAMIPEIQYESDNKGNEFTVVKQEQRTLRSRAKMTGAGHPGFMPTGSGATPYRVFTNYRMATSLIEPLLTESPKRTRKRQSPDPLSLHQRLQTSRKDRVSQQTRPESELWRESTLVSSPKGSPVPLAHSPPLPADTQPASNAAPTDERPQAPSPGDSELLDLVEAK